MPKLNRRLERIKRNLNMHEPEENDVYSNNFSTIDFSKIRVGVKTLEDAVLNLSDYKKLNSRLGDKQEVLRAINNLDYNTMCDISNFFYKTSGIYSRLCRYMAYLYRYDFLVTPYIEKEGNETKLLKDFNESLKCLDNFNVKTVLGDIALKVVKNGCYYGYKVEQSNGSIVLQELPINYCRSRYNIGTKPAIEFNMKFFDQQYTDTEQRLRVLKLFPKDFQKGYTLYKQNKLKPDFPGDDRGWYLLEVDKTVKFNISGMDYPIMISVIPAIIALNEAQALDRKKMEQQLLKIIIQKMPLDKNGEMIFDMDEAKELHNNAVKMLGRAIGLDVLTTFADVDVADLSDTTSTNRSDDLERVERTVYNEAGVSQMQFNTDGNIALEKSILNDEASMYTLLLQFESFLNEVIEKFNKPKKYYFKVQLLITTIYNYKDLSKLYKEQTQLGYSKMLPQIALGQSQSSILANAYFENDILDLVNKFIPPMSSNTMNAEVLAEKNNNVQSNKNNQTEKGEVGRKELADDEKSEKTIMNKESMS